MDKVKKSRYNADVQRRYKQKRKKFACDVLLDEAEKIEQHYIKKGFTSANSYILSLIRADMSETAADTQTKN